jgi:MOSC domain-containing protein YiiM
MTGKLVAIYTAPGEAALMEGHDEIAAIAGTGLAGDRYAEKVGAFSDNPKPGRQVTLIAREGIDAANGEGVTIGEHETRRNLVTEGIDLSQLVGRTFTVGDVVMRGVRDCPPCTYLEGLTRPGVMAALKGRGGLRADIVSAGTLRVGDKITEVDAV